MTPDPKTKWRERREQWRLVEEWERSRPAEAISPRDAFEWNKRVLAIAARHGPLDEPSIDETAAHLARLRDVLRHLPA